MKLRDLIAALHSSVHHGTLTAHQELTQKLSELSTAEPLQLGSHQVNAAALLPRTVLEPVELHMSLPLYITGNPGTDDIEVELTRPVLGQAEATRLELHWGHSEVPEQVSRTREHHLDASMANVPVVHKGPA